MLLLITKIILVSPRIIFNVVKSVGIEDRELNKFEPLSLLEPLCVTRIQWQALQPNDRFPELVNIFSYTDELKKHKSVCKAATLLANNHVKNLPDKDSEEDWFSDDYFVYGRSSRTILYLEKEKFN